MKREPSETRIAVVGLSALFPGSKDVAGFWEDVLAGRDRLSEVPPTHWLAKDYFDPDPSAPDKIYVTRGGFLDPIEFDPIAWGVPPAVVPATDSTQLLALVVAQQVLEDAWQKQFASVDRERMSVILGVTGAQKLLGEMNSRLQRPVWIKALREMGLPEAQVQEAAERIAGHYVPWQESTFPGILGNVVAGRIANRLDLGGTNCVIDAACASSLSALAMAMDELTLGHSDVVICGGADTMNDPFMFTCFAKTTALSKSGECRPFDVKADGTMLGEGVGMLALMRLDDAVACKNHVYAVIRGLGSASDGRATSVYAPLPSGQARAIRRAYERAGIEPESVELVEAHGTGTSAGDAAEVQGLKLVFGEKADAPWCALGSVKSQIGHTKAAAGAAGLIKAVLALHHGILPPTIKVDEPSPALGLSGSPFYLSTQARPWISDRPRRAGVSAFGFGGSNFHVLVEEHSGPERAARLPAGGDQLFVLSGSAHEVAGLARELMQESSDRALRFLARRSQQRFDAAAPMRLALVAASASDLRAGLELALPFVDKQESFTAPSGVALSVDRGGEPIAFLFPGQGSQYVGMGAALAMRFSRARAVWDREAARGLHRLVFPIPGREDDGRLTHTENAQPALGLTSLAYLEMLSAMGVSPAMCAGHSFGENVALSCAGAIDQAALLRLACERGRLMAEAAKTTDGAMIAVNASLERVRAWLSQSGLPLVIANHNHPEQVVLSGAKDAVQAAQSSLRSAKLRASALEVATAFHSPIVAGAVEPFAKFIAGEAVHATRVPVYANSSAAPYPADAAAMRTLLAEQLAQPVRFAETIEAMYAAGARTFVEVGASAVLSGLVSRTLSGKPHRAIALDRKNGLRPFWSALAQLAAAGVPLRLDALWEEEREPIDPKTLPKPKLVLEISGANYGKPFPREASLPAVMETPVVPKKIETPAPREPAPVLEPAPINGHARLAVPAPAAPSSDWLTALVETQRATAEAHAAYSRAMASAHEAFLRTSELAIAQLTGGVALPAAAAPAPVAISLPAAPLLPAPEVKAPAIAPGTLPQPLPRAGGELVKQVQMEIAPILLEVVALKTGYPSEMLQLSMELEADLGVDSIKRVEILAALKQRVPSLPDLDPARLGKLRTLQEIVSLLDGLAPGTLPQPLPLAGGEQVREIAPILLEVVALKTGYPSEMLQLSMELEADLGVDSIKRVEILAALKQRVPSLPDLDPARLGKLRTLQEIVSLLETLAPGTLPQPLPRAGGELVKQVQMEIAPILLEVVALKTGYPSEMLQLSMELEADLGVDSIKRVEILAALKQRVPSLPDLDPARLGKLRTLQEIVSLLETLAPGTLPQPLPRAGGEPAKKELPLARARVVRREARRPSLAAPGLFAAARLAVLCDRDELGQDLVRRLRDAGVAAHATDRIAPEDDGAILIATASGRASWQSAFDAARAFAARASREGGLFVLVAAAPALAPFAALAKSAALEWPKACVRALELASPSVDDVLRELFDGGRDPEIAIDASGGRRAPVLDSLAAPAVTRAIAPIVLASGGARGVTAACLIELARERGGHYVLLGRTALDDAQPEVADADLERAILSRERMSPREAKERAGAVRAAREARATIAALERAGAKAQYLAVDVRDKSALQASLTDARARSGPFNMLVHGAGVLADRRLEDKRDEDFARVVGTKVDGLEALLAALADDPLESIVLFSSVAGRFGNVGQSDYAMANAALGDIAHREQQARLSARVVSLEWGPWKGGMVSPELARLFESRGVPLIDLEAGARLFAAEALAEPERANVIVVGDPLVTYAATEARFPIRVSRASHPQLLDHAIASVPVLPVVLVLEWIARAARAIAPELALVRIRELQVLRGVRLDQFERGQSFELALRRIRNGHGATYAVELGSDRGVHYRAELDLLPERPTGASLRPPPANLGARAAAIYGGALFHGPRFQVIHKIDGIGEAGATAWLSGTAAQGWPDEDWALDPALLDGALQLAVLWAEARVNGACLPTGLDALHVHAPGAVSGEVKAIVHAHGAGTGQARCDVVLVDRASGRLVAELRGLSMHVRPSTLASADV